MSNITIVLAADTGYAEQVHTLMKSICTHNTNVNFYLMHNTFRREWIDYTNQKLAASGGRLNDVKIEMDFSQYHRLPHISDAAFFRLMMQHLPVDRALYLDSDMVITQSLHDLFSLDMRGYPVAAVQDSFLARTEWNHPTGLHTTPYFNSGMLLVNLAQWREHNIAAQLLQTAATIDKSVPYGDQCFLNTVFQKNWLQLEESWNFQTGAVQYFQKRNLSEVFPKPDTVPPVIHYTTRAKPWLCDYGEIPFIEVYWQYYCADWPEA
ncbi:glycosyl transferase family 8 [Neisseria sp. HMSC073G10]|jgi:glycosyl transferase, family 8|uniref:glycosyltransferase family 8 protein n=1 Tax=Neisseria sp. HMSC073G10 TaxID=1739369 RepID=UPI0008A38C81|nr:glycosyltransferase family 8 protein [Neisseria sp. HMSC073G10]OFR81920.1 glycosyl transferase family 8 [Neisseria sp. HMSC073G10]